MALARALAVEPQVLLLDEPFGALDATVRAELRQWLRRLHDEQGVTTVLVTHDQEEAMEVADRIAVMHEGKIEQVGCAARGLRRARERLRDGLPRPGQQARRQARAPARRDGLAGPRRRARSRRWCRRVVHLGFEVRIELELPGGEQARAQLTRAQTEPSSSSSAGDIVYVRPPTLDDAGAEQRWRRARARVRQRVTQASGSSASLSIVGGS